MKSISLDNQELLPANDKYESPIEFFTKTVAPKIAAKIDEQALEAVFQCGFNVDREELEKALRYDRDQWRKGFAAGVEHAQPKWISVKDRLPDNGEKVLVCGVKGGIQAGVFRGLSAPNLNHAWHWKQNTCLKVVCWMSQKSLPEPPKEG